MNNMKHTWASGAVELLEHADSHIKLESAFDKRIAFISIDNSTGTAIRTFISLPYSRSGVKFHQNEIGEARNSFPKLVGLVFKYAADRVVGLDDGDIEHYHRIRNQLYHEGTGLSVDEGYLNAYRQIASVLLKNLFGVAGDTPVEPASLGQLILLWNQVNSELKRRMDKEGIAYGHTYKWEMAQRAGILEMALVQDITELRMIRNRLVHSTADEVDLERVRFGVVLGWKILRQLEG